MDIHRLKSVEEVEVQAAKRLASFLKLYERQDVLFLSSGGSAMRMLDALTVVDARQLTIGVLDERWSHNDTVNNYLQFKKTSFYRKAVEAGAHVIDTSVREGEDLHRFGDRMERQLRNWRLAHKHGIMIATIGIGSDGHIAGIFPYPELPEMFKESFLSDDWVYAYSAVGKHVHEDRSTVTISFLRHEIKHCIAVIHGVEKQEALIRALEGEGTLAETPARILQGMQDLYLYTDL